MTENSRLLPVRRALISVYDKCGLVEFARRLVAQDIELFSTGGTGRLLAEQGIAYTEVSEYTGCPEMMDGRVKTLHPRVHGGILGRPGVDDDTMGAQGILAFDLVVINLYPFTQTLARADCTHELAMENVDIGGPAMLRAAAKNHKYTAAVSKAERYEAIADALEQGGGLTEELCLELAAEAFEHTATYDRAVADYLSSRAGDSSGRSLSQVIETSFIRKQELRYGENPHQAATLYVDAHPAQESAVNAQLIQGKALSYNNIVDADTALESVRAFEQPACSIVKHANPCGLAIGSDIMEAYSRACATDPSSAFGGIIAFNRNLDARTARTILERQFVEVIVAPGIDDDCNAVLESRPNLRVLVCGPLSRNSVPFEEVKRVNGGLLVQSADCSPVVPITEMTVVSERAPTEKEVQDLQFAWQVVKHVKSNAIVYCRDGQTLGIGAGQTSRVYSARLASLKAADQGLDVRGSVMASDAFFPFRDAIETADAAGITAVIQPGGSMRDKEVINAANGAGMAMVFTGIRHFRH